MKQVLQYMNTGETKIVEVPVPQVQKKTALVRTAASLVSAGTERSLVAFGEKNLLQKATSRPDLMKQVLDKARREGLLSTIESAFNRLDQPLALGYSSAGVIVEVGEGLEGFQIGDKVVCTGGNHAVHAEYAVVPQNLLSALPDGIDFESAAFSTLGSIALNGIRLAKLGLGDRVAVVGLGLLGLLTTRLVEANGCEVTGIDTSEQRVRFAQSIGCQAYLRSEIEGVTASLTNGRGFDAVLICAATSSDDTVHLAGEITRDCGYVISLGVVGLDLPRKPYYEKELHFQVSRSTGPGRYDPAYEEEGHDYPIGYVRWTEGRNLEAFTSLLQSGKLKVDDLITHTFDIEDAEQAYEIITGKQEAPYLGIVLTYPREEQAQATKILAQENTPTKNVKVGVIGAGNYAKATFLPAMQKCKDMSMVGIASINGVNAQHVSKKFGFDYATSSSQEILDDETINTVVLLTRHDEHASLTLQALEKGKHVYCEKPLATNLNDLDEIESILGKSNNSMLTIGFNRRFAPMSEKLSAFFKQRQEPLAMHYTVNAGFLPSSHWLHDSQVGGGRIIGEACHFIDYLTFLTGSIPTSVYTAALPDIGKYHQDNVHIHLNFADGSIGFISYLANGDKSFPKERIEVFCEGKVAVLDDFRKLHLTARGNKRSMRSVMRQDKGHRAAWAGFVQSVKHGANPPIPYEQLFAVSRASIYAVQAMNEKKVIDLPR